MKLLVLEAVCLSYYFAVCFVNCCLLFIPETGIIVTLALDPRYDGDLMMARSGVRNDLT